MTCTRNVYRGIYLCVLYILRDMPYYEFTMLYRKRHLGNGGVLEFIQSDDKSAPFQTVIFGAGHKQKDTHVMGLVKKGNFSVPTLIGHSIPNNRCIAAGDKENSRKYMLAVISFESLCPLPHPTFGVSMIRITCLSWLFQQISNSPTSACDIPVTHETCSHSFHDMAITLGTRTVSK